MKKNKNVFILLVFITGFLWSCNENSQNVSDIAVFVSPSSSSLVVVSSTDKVNYALNINTSHNNVTRFSIRSFDSYQGEKTLVDTVCDKNKITYNYIFTAPEIDRDSLNVELFFNAWDNDGNTCEVTRNLIIKNKLVLIGEKSGIVLYSGSNETPNALSFSSPTQTFNLATSPDSSKADLFIDADSSFVNAKMRSNTIAKFVRNNTFDYAGATSISIQSVYANSKRSDIIDDLQINDIILVGHGTQAQGVIHINNIIRNGNMKCIQFSYKEIRR